ncbi:hypothetical protein A2276_04135 [candidate division WOR-1 bacterium RIFOXYA12_FULL_43_27]|uniref:AAA+ ATPase domain-containing protein n=1 Tax=candidate division WOR-1 bacterium RIFOXYC2_FULL_46_14 TaxID=1802587 RepID=A0A1F4U724_UNCSA|nr:MAG: hypothetical protein A2276_04135 [candidate division WOR-1 bacterium RIFOXYA12_FULL_43_27]OGC19121.1 MAG: hypothetical protein A2292_00200 [candidate division WOR-1 bacterium RIFOXYB2_FULL_46_45]OGC30109.1 MAG: hypothetical protein A2232_00200 [candidate division WOR-1 bacterium RIFOXYA2_FULL_46_56]OGC40711.1 MAG: hypothetical protein A2438_00205 [candidate division WOR-1 bacterium RIFOXYC2_FULL_46_14]
MDKLSLKLISFNLVTPVSPAQGAEDAEKEELRPDFLIPFQKRFNLAKVSDVIAREKEITDIMCILATDSNANVLLLGFPGTGKTCLAQAMAKSFLQGEVDPVIITGRSGSSVDFLFMDAADLKAAKGPSAAKVRAIEAYLEKFPNTVIFVDEAHLLGKTELGDSSPIIELMKPMLNRPYSHFIFATTVEEHRKYLAVIPAVDRRWTILPIAESDPAVTRLILRQHRGTLLNQDKYRSLPFSVVIPDQIIALIVELAGRYVPSDRCGYNPSRSIKLLEQALARLVTRNSVLVMRYRMNCTTLVKLFSEYVMALRQRDETSVKECQGHIEKQISAYLSDRKSGGQQETELRTPDLYEALSILTGLPYESFERLDRRFLDTLAAELKKRIVGQDSVMDVIASRIRRARLGLSDPRKPVFTGLFAGKTGTGKTETAKMLARLLFGGEAAMVVINGPEYDQEWKISRLIGASAGYIGYDDKCKFEEISDHGGRCVILIDEFEKMTPKAQDIFLKALDEGEVETAAGKRISFKEAVIIFTSNLGSDKLVYRRMENVAEDFQELLEFRRQTILAVEALAEKREAESQRLQTEARFEEAEKFSAGAAKLRRFLAERTGDLQRGIFPQDDIEDRELKELLAEREKEDREIKDSIEGGGANVFARRLKKHREKTAREFEKRKAGIHPAKFETHKDIVNILEGEYATALLSGDPETEEIERWLKEQETVDRDLSGKLAAARRADQDCAEIERKNSETIERCFREAGYKPEFLGRIKSGGGIYAFNPVSRKMAAAILKIRAKKFIEQQKRFFWRRVEIATDVFEYVLSRVGDLESEGGRGVERTFNDLIVDRLSQELMAAEAGTNAQIAIYLEGSKIAVNITALEEADVSSLPPQEGEAGKLLAHFHEQALAVSRMFADYSVTVDEIKRLLNGEKIVDGGKKPAFAAREKLVSGNLPAVLSSFRGTPLSKGIGLLGMHLQAEEAEADFVAQVQAVAKGLVLMSAKTLFNFTLGDTFKNRQETYDLLTAKANGSQPLVEKVQKAAAAVNAVCEWGIESDSVGFKIAVPCKLTEKELAVLRIYSEGGATDSEALRQLFEANKKKGLTLDLSLFRGYAELKKRFGDRVDLGFYIEEGEDGKESRVVYWFKSPVPKQPKTAAAPAAKPAGTKPAKPPAAFDAKKAEDTDYLKQFITDRLPAWDEIPFADLAENDEFKRVHSCFSGHLKNAAELAGSAEEVEEYVLDAVGMVRVDAPVFDFLLLRALEEAEIDIPVRNDLKSKTERHAQEREQKKRMLNLATGFVPEKEDIGQTAALFASLSAKGSIEVENGTVEDFEKILSGTDFLLRVSADVYLRKLLSQEDCRLNIEMGNRTLTLNIQMGGYSFARQIEANPSDDAGKKAEISEKVGRFIEEFDVVPRSILPEESWQRAFTLIEEINGTPFAGKLAERLAKHVAVNGGLLDIFRQALNASPVAGARSTASGKAGVLDFKAAVALAKTVLVKRELNRQAASPEERPYTEEEIDADIAEIEAGGQKALAGALRRRKNSSAVSLDEILGVDFLGLVSSEQVDFWSGIAANALKKRGLPAVPKIVKKGKEDSSFAGNILPRLADGVAALVETDLPADFELALQLANTIVALSEICEHTAVYRMFNLVAERLIEGAGNVEKIRKAREFLSGLSEKWLATSNPANFLCFINKLLNQTSDQAKAVNSELKKWEGIARFATPPNQLEVCQVDEVDPLAVDTVALFLGDRALLEKAAVFLNKAIKEKRGPFADDVFSGAGGAVALLKVRRKKGGLWLEVSVSGKSFGASQYLEEEKLD